MLEILSLRLQGRDRALLFRGILKDTLIGGQGKDTFVLYSKSELGTIKDFSKQQGDKIQIVKSTFGATSTDQFSYNNGALFFQGTQFATLEDKPNFSTSSDIELV